MNIIVLDKGYYSNSPTRRIGSRLGNDRRRKPMGFALPGYPAVPRPPATLPFGKDNLTNIVIFF